MGTGIGNNTARPSKKSSHPEYSIKRTGRPFSSEYRIYFERTSPFCSLEYWDDILDKKPRFVKNCFPYKGYLWNYGALPQTWEDPHSHHPDTHAPGDNDPLDVIEIGRAVARPGDVLRVRPLGILGLLDEGKTDWKLLVINVDDPLARGHDALRDIGDVEDRLPGLLDAARDWFRIYKVPDGKKPNDFAFHGAWRDRKYAERIIDECEDAWKKLVHGQVKAKDVSVENTTLDGTPGKLDPDSVSLPKDEDRSPAPVEQDLDEWFYLDRDNLEGDVRSEGGMNIMLELG
ncbi:hypothetical protein VTJ49DRAFT_5197 [Mycothermus thermophilus]|uniref:inorganic diphosphatase n=1 Tax=Humicola insolens TaxID=85995 RepID=A0ABR3VKN2_HUMIN